MTTTDDPGGGEPGEGQVIKQPSFIEVVKRGGMEDGSLTFHLRTTILWPASEGHTRKKPTTRDLQTTTSTLKTLYTTMIAELVVNDPTSLLR
ncbi:MAG: hypothetical protein ACREBR_00455 [bacterium]